MAEEIKSKLAKQVEEMVAKLDTQTKDHEKRMEIMKAKRTVDRENLMAKHSEEIEGLKKQ
jgi:hypothetical protein